MIKKIYRYSTFVMLVTFSGAIDAKQNVNLDTENAAASFIRPLLAAKAKLSSRHSPINKRKQRKTLTVIATAYTSHRNQTDSTPNIAAWGDRLQPGMKVIAVSRDLLTRYKLKRGTLVKIRGLAGQYMVLDKMNKRWRKKIDIYMGKNKKKAFRWGRKKVVIEWGA